MNQKSNMYHLYYFAAAREIFFTRCELSGFEYPYDLKERLNQLVRDYKIFLSYPLYLLGLCKFQYSNFKFL